MSEQLSIEVIDSKEQFHNLRKSWDIVYESDSQVTIHRSWSWLWGWFNTTDKEWFVVAAKNGAGRHVAYLPLAIKADKDRYEIVPAGYPWAAHSGFLCLPQYEDRAIQLIANYLMERNKWEVIRIADFLDRRTVLFLQAFPKMRVFVTRLSDSTCPYIDLPESWDLFEKQFDAKRLKRLRYILSRLQKEIGYSEETLTEVDNDAVLDDDELLMEIIEIWQERFGRVTDRDLITFRRIFRECRASGKLWAKVIKDEGTVVAGCIGFLDREKKYFSPMILVHNAKYDKYSPGKVIAAHSISHAISCGVNYYDFGRGGSEYKYWLGAHDDRNENYTIEKYSLSMLKRYIVLGMRILKSHIVPFVRRFHARVKRLVGVSVTMVGLMVPW